MVLNIAFLTIGLGLALDVWLEWTVGSTVTDLTAVTALARELALDMWVHAVRLVVAHLATVVALAKIPAAATLLARLRAAYFLFLVA